eukprot:gnl/TRDRNA2_/TRDRNA2_177021_c2_seq2.p1 gnl/TRDRNA2_/TRDRNA2_177021_c2~~gnl/TRDRNA2_/TRDRNA2_177021_c2_seq2.p1  ORF type:complete len:173 (-),score=16.29 gnl/TRDRNA2_/TRDRNA2_177021_c2_seq2:20-496(-)
MLQVNPHSQAETSKLAATLWYVACGLPALLYLLVAFSRDWRSGKRLLLFVLHRIVPFAVFGLATGIAYYYHFTKFFCGALPDMPGFGSGLSIVGFVLGFVLVGRLNFSLARWWEAKSAVVDLCGIARAHSGLLSAVACETAKRVGAPRSHGNRSLHNF